MKLAGRKTAPPGEPDTTVENAAGSPQVGILLMVAAGVCFALLDTGAKYLTADHHVLQVVWGRYFFSLAFLPLIVGRVNPLRVARTGHLTLQIVRSLLLLAATAFFFTAVHFIPLADATAISFVAPLLLTMLSIPLLGETVGRRRWTAVIVGLIGALIVIRPGFGQAGWAAMLPLFSALAYTLYLITTRMLSAIDSSATIFLYTGLVGTLVMTAVVPFFWTAPTLGGWLLMITLGLLGGGGHYLVIQAFRRAPASALSPFGFVVIIWTTTTGYLVFGDVPDAPTILGATIIIASAVFVFYRESVVRRAANGA
jgi:drug/metabolite transporter (DMT)-like permease